MLIIIYKYYGSNLESNENEIYYIKMGETKNKLLIKVYPKEKIKNCFYQLTYDLDDFQKIAKGFKMCETLKEVYAVLKEIINSKKARIIKENIIFSLY